MKKGLFITVEGVGKTKNIKFIQGLLTKADIRFVATREPGGTPNGRRIAGSFIG